MTMLQIRDWLRNLKSSYLNRPAIILVNGKYYEINNWRIGAIDNNTPIEGTKAEFIWY